MRPVALGEEGGDSGSPPRSRDFELHPDRGKSRFRASAPVRELGGLVLGRGVVGLKGTLSWRQDFQLPDCTRSDLPGNPKVCLADWEERRLQFQGFSVE
ncbi:hypothetical protein JTB14_013242 [Gonioctena quinquepunctata]|nr:hypothetical protein JTB14_013242 [Gonioctena quinquepunctata]